MMKKILSMVLVLALLATSVFTAVAAFAEDGADITYTLSTVEKQPGETIPAGTQFDVQVSVSEIAALCMVEYKFCYDKALMKPVTAVKAGVLNAMDYANVVTDPTNPVLGGATYGEVWITGMALEPKAAAADEVIATITFETLADINKTSRMFCCGEALAASDPVTVTPLKTAFVDGGIVFRTAQPTTTTTEAAPVVSGKVSLLPPSASDFVCVEGGGGTLTVTKAGDGYKFTPDQAWPNAWYMPFDQSDWVTVDVNDPDARLYWDFTAASAVNILVFFAGQNPADQAAEGTYRSLNILIDPTKVDAAGNILDLEAGTYKDSIHVSELGCAENFIVDGKFTISGIKVFAVNGTVIVNELAAVGESAKAQVTTTTAAEGETTTTAAEGETTTTAAEGETTTTAAEGETTTTTVAGGETTSTTAAVSTTTVKQPDAPKNDSPKTADNTEVLLFVSVCALALAAVVMAATMKKQSA